jgi:protein TonB
MALPRTALLRRRSRRAWSLAVGLAVVVNLAVVALLAQISQMRFDAPAPPLAARILPRAEAVPPPPPLAAPTAAAALADSGVTAAETPLALPPLDVPPLATGRLVLPEATVPDLGQPLPLVVPPVVAIAPAAGHDGASSAHAIEPDSPAMRTGDIDLERFYPRTARSRGVTGSTHVRLAIDGDGAVTRVTVIASDPPGIFERAAEQLCQSLRYLPATRAGKPVPSEQETIITWVIR